MNFINEHVSSNFYSRQLILAVCKEELARIKVAGHVFINEIHSVVFPHFRVILRTDRPMALCYGRVFPSKTLRNVPAFARAFAWANARANAGARGWGDTRKWV